MPKSTTHSPLIRLASTLPKGSTERRSILSLIKDRMASEKDLPKKPSGDELFSLFNPTDLVYFTKPSSGEEKRVDLGELLKKIPSVKDESSAEKAAKLFLGIRKKMDSHKKSHSSVRKSLWQFSWAGERLNEAISKGDDTESLSQSFDKALEELKSEIKRSGIK